MVLRPHGLVKIKASLFKIHAIYIPCGPTPCMQFPFPVYMQMPKYTHKVVYHPSRHATDTAAPTSELSSAYISSTMPARPPLASTRPSSSLWHMARKPG